jgi:hypothetical protein
VAVAAGSSNAVVGGWQPLAAVSARWCWPQNPADFGLPWPPWQLLFLELAGRGQAVIWLFSTSKSRLGAAKQWLRQFRDATGGDADVSFMYMQTSDATSMYATVNRSTRFGQ